MTKKCQEGEKMKVISFLGVGEYKKVTYYWQNKMCQTHLFPEAVAKIFEPEKVFVLTTSTALNRSKAYIKELKEILGDLVEFVSIPEGKSEAELWQIFEKCVELVEEGDEVLIDITHAFRSIPFIFFAVAAYLRRTKNVTIRHIVYGAYEAREPFREKPEPTDRVPIFDLTPILHLFDWLSGTEFLLQRSDAALLANILRRIHKDLWRMRTSEKLPTKLECFSNVLYDYSRALHFSRPLEVMTYAAELLKLVDEVKPEVERWAKPFGVVLDKVRLEAVKFAYNDPKILSEENLRKQLELIEYYLEKDLTVQAITLAREWIVSWIALQSGERNWLNRDIRSKIEEALGAAVARSYGEQTSLPEWFDQLPKSKEIVDLWSWISNLRNDLAHCGMRENALEIEKIEKMAKEVVRKLSEF